MENMDRTDQSLQSSKQELTTTIAHLVDTIEEMHTSFGAFMRKAEARMAEDKNHIQNLEQQTITMLSAHGSMDAKLEDNKQHINAVDNKTLELHNDLGALQDHLAISLEDFVNKRSFEQYRQRLSDEFQTHIEGMKEQERVINQLRHDLDSLRSSHEQEVGMLHEELTALKEAHAKSTKKKGWLWSQQHGDPYSQYHLED